MASTERLETFPERLEQARTLRGLTMEELADKLDYSSRSTVWSYEQGAVSPSLALVRRLAEALEVDAVWLAALPGVGLPPKDD